MLVGKGKGIAVEAASVPVPHFLKSFSRAETLPSPNLLFRYASPALRAIRNVIYAPITDPAVATAAYSYQGFRWLAARIAIRMSGPPNVGSGELSRIARKKSPSAPRWVSIEVKLRPLAGLRVWIRRFSMGDIGIGLLDGALASC